MSYQVLPTNLHSTADRVRGYLRNDYGVQRIVTEQSIDDEVDWRPTISGSTRDHHIVCVEVTDASYSDSLDKAVLQCMTRGLPVRLFIAFPGDEVSDKSFRKTINDARERGIGIIEVRRRRCKLIHAAIALSLASVRRVDPKRYSTKRRQAVVDAQATFLNGDPVKGCSRIYDEIESLSRALAKKAADKGWWPPSGDLDTKAWARLMDTLIDDVDMAALRRASNRKVDRALLNRVRALTPHRNEAGHKPRNRVALIRRDSQLRTRFEHASDVLADLDAGLRSLRL